MANGLNVLMAPDPFCPQLSEKCYVINTVLHSVWVQMVHIGSITVKDKLWIFSKYLFYILLTLCGCSTLAMAFCFAADISSCLYLLCTFLEYISLCQLRNASIHSYAPCPDIQVQASPLCLTLPFVQCVFEAACPVFLKSRVTSCLQCVSIAS